MSAAEFEVVSSPANPFVTLECTECGSVLDSADAAEHAELHQSAAEAERTDGFLGLMAWLLANKGGGAS